LLVASVTVHSTDGQRLGTAIVGIRREYITHTIGKVRYQQIPILISLLSAGIASAFFLMSHLLRPLAALRSGIERIGSGDFDRPIQLGARTELGLLAETVNAMASQLKTGQTEARERDRLAHEIELARRIQNSLLPSGRRTFGELAIEGAYRAATEVGGDYYDVIELSRGRVGIAIADVAGKGLGGCMVTSMLHALLHTFSEIHDSPTEILCALDARLGSTLERGRFVSMFYGVLEPETGRIVYASAGHCPLLIYRGATKTVEWQYTEGIPLCAIGGGVLRKTLQDLTVEVGPGDLLVQYTDGVNEATDASGCEQFGFEQIERAVQTAGSRGPAAVVDALQQAVERWRGGRPPEDDETLLVIARTGAGVRDRRGLEQLAAARKGGRRLVLPATTDSLELIRDWIGSCPLLEDLPADQLEMLHLALYEACANVAEHAYQENPAQKYELWWVPPNRAHPGAAREGRGAPEDPLDPGKGFFLLRDDGTPYCADNWHETDFSDPAVWRRRRGFGRDIIQRVMDEVAYYPATGEGNLVVMAFDPSGSLEELRNSDARNRDHEPVV
jgi:serine phosphatase RsbU (regulator of sigma subunit)/anti-sigma regulatory factor (Ser/Thr protein kinase)